GIPLRYARRAVAAAVRHFERAQPPAGTAHAGMAGDAARAGAPGDAAASPPAATLVYTLPEPWGVCALILPDEPPLERTARVLAGALAAGNAVVVKPAEAA